VQYSTADCVSSARGRELIVDLPGVTDVKASDTMIGRHLP